MKGWVQSVGWVLMGLLVIAGVLISAGKRESSTSPKSTSYYPSGTAALSELLRRNGYRVEVDLSPKPKLAVGDVAVAFKTNTASFFNNASDSSSQVQTQEYLTHSAEKGAVVIWFPVSTEFEVASNAVSKPSPVTRFDGQQRLVSSSSRWQGFDRNDVSINLLSSGENAFVSADKTGSGYQINYADGIGLTNRFIDKADNAKSFLEVLRAFAKPGARVVFTEAAFGNVQEPGLLETIGPWAEGSWFQALFLLVVVVFTLNRRFGLPEEVRAAQRGGRELLDAITDTLTRAKASQMTLESAANLANTELRSALKMPKDATDVERDRLLPESLRNALANVRAGTTIKKMPPKEALKLIQNLEKEMDLFLGERRSFLSSRRRRAIAKGSRAA